MDQVDRDRLRVSRAPRKPAPTFHYERRGRKSTRWRTGPGPQFPPDESRIARDHSRDGDPQLLPPQVRPRRPLRGRGGIGTDARIANYAAQTRGRGVKTRLTPAQRRRVAHKARMTESERATI